MVRSYLPILALFAVLGAAAGFYKAAVPHQEAAVPKAAASNTLSASFDEGLDNPDVVSDMNIHPARKCGFCMGVSALICILASSLMSMLICAEPHSTFSCRKRYVFLCTFIPVSRADELPRLRPLGWD